MKPLISLIIPGFNEEDSLPYIYHALDDVSKKLSDYDMEFLFVDDGSKDATLHQLKKYATTDHRCIFLSFSKNFGKEAAMYAGFCNAKGDYVAVLDADLQDPPELLIEMLEIIRSGKYDSVATRRSTRKGEPVLRSFFARMFYRIINKISDAEIVDGARDFRLMTCDMVDSIISTSEYNRFSKGIFGWIGFRTYWLSYENKERVDGDTKWSFWKLFKYSLDGIVNFSQVPLSFASICGILMTGIAFIMVMVIFIIARKLIFDDPVAGWTSLVCIITFIGGIQLFALALSASTLQKFILK